MFQDRSTTTYISFPEVQRPHIIVPHPAALIRYASVIFGISCLAE